MPSVVSVKKGEQSFTSLTRWMVMSKSNWLQDCHATKACWRQTQKKPRSIYNDELIFKTLYTFCTLITHDGDLQAPYREGGHWPFHR